MMIELSARFALARRFTAGLLGFALAVPLMTAQIQPPPAPAAQPQAAGQTPAQTAPPQQAPQSPGVAPPPSGQRSQVRGLQFGGFTLQNASLAEVVDSLARQLKLNYILPPKFSGSVTLNTFGDMREIDPKNLLDLILRINGFGMVEAGGIYRIVPLQDVSHQPIPPETKSKNIDADESLMLNLVFLKYITADELAKVLAQFIGEGGQLVTYAPANLLFILDSRRNMRRTMELVSLFDDNSLAKQRVKLYEVKNGRPTDLAHELEGIFKGISMTDKLTTIRFVPVDRINTLIAVAPNPGVFETVDKWLDKLDVAGEVTAGAIDNFVYRVKYGEAEFLSMAIYSLYTGQPMFGGGGYGGYGGGGGFGGSSFGGSSFGGGGFGGGGFGGGYGGGFGGGGFGGGGGISGGAINYPAAGAGGTYGAGNNSLAMGSAFSGGGAGGTNQTGAVGALQGGNLAGGVGQTGAFLAEGAAGSGVKVPHIIANPLDNTLLIQATPAEYKSILKLLTQIDVPPRQVLIDAKIYEVDVSDVYGGSLTACVQLLASATNCLGGATPPTNANGSPINGLISAALTGTGATATLATVVDTSRQLLAALQLTDTYSKGKSISTPSVIATDSIPASINVGSSVPSISGQAVATGVQQGGSTGFYQNIQQVDTGVQLQVMARVTPAGVVTMIINQKISAVIGPTGTLTPSFSNRNITTQVTIQDGDTIALGGVIQEAVTEGSGGIPGLSRIPYVGSLFGQQSKGHQRTELIVFLTPHVLYDTNMTVDAADELRGRMKLLQKIMRNDKDQQ
jgi:general secretion pathway protein D